MRTATNPLAERGLKPISVLAANREHGDRLRYAAGCRCKKCRAANSFYERNRERARRSGDWNGIVSADRARSWMAHLSAQGVGRRAIVEATDVSHSVLCEIRAGRKTQIRALTERKILAVTPAMALDGSLVSADEAWSLINELVAAGFTKKAVSERLGYRNGGIQLSHVRITVRNAAEVKKLHGELINSDEALTSAKRVWRMIKELREEGFNDKQLERAFDLPGGLQALDQKRVTVAVEKRITAAFERLMA